MIAVVGATGVTGSRVARETAGFDVDTVLVGRDRAALEELAARTGAREVRTLDLTSPESIRAALVGTQAVVNCVGPSTRWGLPIAQAALATGVHYLDTTGEPGYCMQLLEQLDRPARDRGVCLVPAVATCSLPADFATSLALHHVDAAQATRVSLGYRIRGWKPSAGTIRSEIDMLAAGAPLVEHGRLRLNRAGASTRRLPHGTGVRMPVPDAIVISRYCNVPDIEAFVLAPVPGLVGVMMRAAARLCANPRSRRFLQALAKRLPDRDPATDDGEFTVHATVEGPWGAHTTTATGREVYRSTARYTALVASALAHGTNNSPPGLHAPSEIVDDVESAARRVGLTITHQAPTTANT